MFDSLYPLFTYDLGIDLGTSNIRIFIKGKGIAVREPSVMVWERKTKEVVAIGSQAKKMIGKTPQNLEIIKPLGEGVIADFEATKALLAFFIKEVHKNNRFPPMIPKPKVVVNIPSGVTEVERKAVIDAATAAGARKVFLIEQPLAAALGAGLDIFGSSGVLVVVLGGGVTDMAVISLGGIVQGKCLKVAGEEMNDALINFLRLKYSLLTGELTAEQLKYEIGSVIVSSKNETKKALVRGRDLEKGMPVSVQVTAGEVREALAPVVNQIVGVVSDLIEETPPELLTDIAKTGICLCGGGANLLGIDRLITEITKIPAWIADKPEDCVVRGCGKLLDNGQLLKKVGIEK